MALDLETIRNAAQRVATSHGLDVVDVEMAGGGKHRALRVFIEKNSDQRAELAAKYSTAQRSKENAGPSTTAADAAFGQDDTALDAAESSKEEADSSAALRNDNESSGDDASSGDQSGISPDDTKTLSSRPERSGVEGPAFAPELPSDLKLPDNIEALSGTTHEDCAAFANDFGVLLDIEELVPGTAEYTLEVSSPGLDRKLTTAADYQRFAGSIAKIQTRTPVNGNRHWTGRLTEVTGNEFTLDLSAANPSAQSGKHGKGGKPSKSASKKASAQDTTVRLSISNVEKANLVPEI